MSSLRKMVYVAVPKSSEDSFDSKKLLLSRADQDTESIDINSEAGNSDATQRKRSLAVSRIWMYCHTSLTLLLGILVIALTFNLRSLNRLNPQITYSPAQDIVRYVPRVFQSSLDYGKTIYQGPPSETNNAAWTKLFIHGLTRISAEEAAPMDNKTLPIPDDPEYYITSLSVFHQLHCLNAIRFAVWNQTMDDHHETDMRHLDHCIDMIRQAIMCHSDITPFVWARDPRDGKAKGLSSVTHTCRDFDAIADWAADRPFRTGFNTTGRAKHDPLGWNDHQFVMDFGIITDWTTQEAEFNRWSKARGEEIRDRGPAGYEDRTTTPNGELPGKD